MRPVIYAAILMVTVTLQAARADGLVGEMHLQAHEGIAAVRDQQHRDTLRITIWYPAAPGSAEQEITLGPPTQPLRDVGWAAANAPFADGSPRPVILLSHGFGGTARVMGWFSIALARAGYLVIAVDHPGNNALDPMTVAGASLWWERADDLRTALEAMRRDPAIAPRLAPDRLGVAGFSAGGFTALVAAGARVDRDRFSRFCAAHPDDGVCRPQQEFAPSSADIEAAKHDSNIVAEIAHSADDHSIPGIRAAFAMSPVLLQALDPESLRRLKVPVSIVLGALDTVAPPSTNGLAAAALIPGARIEGLPGVGHYDFLADCTEGGRALIPNCRTDVPQAATHATAINAALALFAGALGQP